ncbi:MAG: non-ribosomal peptide synthetase [Clostridia bacterium]|nr:non-ribosomal peptide synthetase [Clostridia bacterium]
MIESGFKEIPNVGEEYFSSKYDSFVDVLRERANQTPYSAAITYLVDGEEIEEKYTFSEIDTFAKRLALKILNYCKAGDRVVFFSERSIDVFLYFLGCQYAGVVAIPVAPPLGEKAEKILEDIVGDSQAKCVLTTNSTLSNIEHIIKRLTLCGCKHFISGEEIENYDENKWTVPQINSDSIASILYTSGSTGTAKGVMQTNKNHLTSADAFTEAWMPITYERTLVTWMPLHNAFGLNVATVNSLCHKFNVVLLPYTSVVMSPIKWLKAISKYKADYSGTINFLLELCCKKITDEQCNGLDLSSCTALLNSGEKIRVDTYNKFCNKFGRYGYKPEALKNLLGSTETLSLTFGRGLIVKYLNKKKMEKNIVDISPVDGPEYKQVVSAGTVNSLAKVAIVNPDTEKSCKANEIGEIWVKSNTVAKGYWNSYEKVITELSSAYIADTGEGPFYRMGDMGFFYEGQLYLTGRCKAMIIINGKNYYLDDIDELVGRSHPSLSTASCASFVEEIADKERLLLVCEINENEIAQKDMSNIIEFIQNKIYLALEVPVYSINFVKPGEIERSPTGKLIRNATKKKFLNNKMNIVYSWRETLSGDCVPDFQTIEDIEKQTKLIVSSLSDRAPEKINVQTPFAYNGLDSVKLLDFSYQLEKTFKIKIVMSTIFKCRNIKSLCEYIQRNIS